MSRDVKVTINREAVASGVGFGYPLIFEGKATKAIPYTECADINEVIKAVGGITSEDTEETIATKTEAAKATAIYKAAILLLMQNTAPSTIAVCATTETATAGLATILHNGWRQLVVTSVGTEEEDTRKVISNFIETTNKMYFTSVADVSELAGEAAITENDRTVILVHDDVDTTIVHPEAALVGATAGKAAGSINYKYTTLKGLTAKTYTNAQLDSIHAAGAIAYALVSGQSITTSGQATSGEYIDITDGTDYIIQNIEYRTIQLLTLSDKVSYDNTGISKLENVCVNVLKEAANNGIIALTDAGVPDFSVTYKPRSETSAENRAARRYVDGSFRFALAGAVDTVEITGTIEI